MIVQQQLDILAREDEDPGENRARYGVLLDKGTYDAISLMEGFGPSIRELYLKSTCDLLADGGTLVVVTCNWTSEEITKHMETRNARQFIPNRKASYNILVSQITLRSR